MAHLSNGPFPVKVTAATNLFGRNR